jgi:hypothetical protein
LVYPKILYLTKNLIFGILYNVCYFLYVQFIIKKPLIFSYYNHHIKNWDSVKKMHSKMVIQITDGTYNIEINYYVHFTILQPPKLMGTN